jgi:MinD-like ATPase involved in chromosome partitioning or flagellar assembly
VINSINRGVPFISENQTYPVSKSILDLAALVQKKAPENELAGVKGLNGKK